MSGFPSKSSIELSVHPLLTKVVFGDHDSLFFLSSSSGWVLAQFSGQVIFLRSTEKSSTLVALERGAAITFWKASFTGRTIDRDHPMSS